MSNSHIDDSFMYDSEPEFDWNLAPHWAQYWAMDKDGEATWFEYEPYRYPCDDIWISSGGRNVEAPSFDFPVSVWKESLTERCQKQDSSPKVDWNQAPDWANYWAMDESGYTYWYETKPEIDSIGISMWVSSSLADTAPDFGFPLDRWQESLAERLTESTPDQKAVKVDWNLAPKWASHWAVNSDGKAYWFALKPKPDDICEEWSTDSVSVYELAPDFGVPSEQWQESLRDRLSDWLSNSESKVKSDGGSTSYYDLPEHATELRHLISHKSMSKSRGDIFKACYRLGEKDGADVLYDLNKMKFFVEDLIEMYHRGEHL